MPGIILSTEDGKVVSATNPLPVTASVTVGAVSIIDGGDVTQGAKSDAAVQDASSSASLVSLLKGLQAIVGLVTASPTANTLLDRLKTINTTLSAAIPAGTNIIGHIIRDASTLTMTHTAPTAGVASGTALASNANRKYALIVNDSANIVYIYLGATAVLNTGIRLNANGGSYEINETNLYTGNIACISSVVAQNIIVTEGV